MDCCKVWRPGPTTEDARVTVRYIYLVLSILTQAPLKTSGVLSTLLQHQYFLPIHSALLAVEADGARKLKTCTLQAKQRKLTKIS